MQFSNIENILHNRQNYACPDIQFTVMRKMEVFECVINSYVQMKVELMSRGR